MTLRLTFIPFRTSFIVLILKSVKSVIWSCIRLYNITLIWWFSVLVFIRSEGNNSSEMCLFGYGTGRSYWVRWFHWKLSPFIYYLYMTTIQIHIYKHEIYYICVYNVQSTKWNNLRPNHIWKLKKSAHWPIPVARLYIQKKSAHWPIPVARLYIQLHREWSPVCMGV